MKTYVIMLAKTFPKGTVNEGRFTDFENRIAISRKIHTIRRNFRFWEKRFIEIDKGNACISIREWEDKPYRSKQKELFRYTKEDGIGLEKLYFRHLVNSLEEWCLIESIDKKKCLYEHTVIVGSNDGLTHIDFKEWFKNITHSTPFAIIHFTKFRYND